MIKERQRSCLLARWKGSLTLFTCGRQRRQRGVSEELWVLSHFVAWKQECDRTRRHPESSSNLGRVVRAHGSAEEKLWSGR